MRFRTFSLILIALGAAAGSFGALRFEHPVAFLVLLIAVVVTAIVLRPKEAAIVCATTLTYVVTFTWLVLNPEPSVELLHGAILWILASATPIFINHSRNTMRIRESYLTAVLDRSPIAIVTLRPDHSITGWNSGAEDLFGYDADEVMGRNIDQIVVSNNRAVEERAHHLTEEVNGGQTIDPHVDIRYGKEGNAVHVIVAGAPIIVDGERVGVVATYTSVEEQHQANERIKGLLAEKEMLVGEVQHRVKNHMGTLQAILELAGSSEPTGTWEQNVAEITSKVRILGHAYSMLYQNPDVQTVDLEVFSRQIVDDFAQLTPPSISIDLKNSGDLGDVSAQQSFPLGIILNELLTNALKYAFPQGKSGAIHVSLGRGEGSVLELSVADDGVGMPGSADNPPKFGFGLQMVEAYVQQYGGSLEFIRDHGTEIRIKLGLRGT